MKDLRTAPDDNAVMVQVRNGDVAKLAILFERHHRVLFNFFARMSGRTEGCDDLVQEVFFRMLKSRHTFDGASPYAPWMYQIARNVFIDNARKRRWDGVAELGPELVSPGPRPDEVLGRAQSAQMLRRALAALPEDKRELLVLSRYQELPYEDIGRIVGCATGTVKVRVFRALRELGRAYSDLTGEKVS
jgi:RNA polymerase sigma-70 factor (ECF subfamily)